MSEQQSRMTATEEEAYLVYASSSDLKFSQLIGARDSISAALTLAYSRKEKRFSIKHHGETIAGFAK